VGKSAGQWRAETERRQHAEKENDVSRRPKEDCRSTTGAVGEGQGCAEEDGVKTARSSRKNLQCKNKSSSQ
jgi:hypothetical protein